MKLSDIHPDLADPADPADPQPAEERLLREAATAAHEYQQLHSEYLQANQGYRRRLYEFNAKCYEIGSEFAVNHGVYANFLEHAYFKSLRQNRGLARQHMKAVLTFAMRPTTSAARGRIIKTAAVLQYIHAQDLPANLVADYLVEHGGVEKLYRTLHPRKSPIHGMWDDLEYSENPPVKRQASPASAERYEGNNVMAGADETDDEAPLDDQHDRSDDGPPTSDKPEKRKKLQARVTLDGHLLIDLRECDVELEEVFRMKRIQVNAIVGRQESDGFYPVVACEIREVAK